MKRIAIVLLFGAASALVTPRAISDSQIVINAEKPIEEITVDTWQAIQAATSRVHQKSNGFQEELEEVALGALLKGKTLSIPRPQDLASIVADVVQGINEEVEGWLQNSHDDSSPEAPIWPGDPAPPLDLRQYTIGQILNWTLHLPPDHPPDQHLPLRKLGFLVNISEPIQKLLHDPKADITLFAPDDNALTPPSRRGGHHHGFSGRSSVSGVDTPFDMHMFWDAQAEMQAEACPHYRDMMEKKHGGDDKNRREKRRRIFLHILEIVLKYHVSPGAKTLPEILDASTLGSSLPTSFAKDAASFRIRVGEPKLIPFNNVDLNFFSKLNTRRIDAKNGVIYLIEHAPLLPPLTSLSMLYLFPQPFSTLTGGIAKAGLDAALLPSYGNKSVPMLVDSMLATPMYGGLDEVDSRVSSMLEDIVKEKKTFNIKTCTVFAPTNRAFAKLGMPINAFLFSPWGTPILRYLLSYHVIPGIAFHTDHITNATSYSSSTEINTSWPDYSLTGHADELRELATFFGPHPDEPPHGPPGMPPTGNVNVTHHVFPTLLGNKANQSIAVDVVQYRLRFGKGPIARRVVVKPPFHEHGPPPKPIVALVADAVAWSGAVHIIPELIRPPYPDHMHHKDDHNSAASLNAMWEKMWQ